MQQVAPDVWLAETPQSFGGFEMGARMTVIRLADGGLFLHSPVHLSDLLRIELERLGRPRWAVAPNRFHHLYVGDYLSAYPDLQLHIAPGLEVKRPDLAKAAILGDEPPLAWRGQIDQALVHGYPLLNEVVFHHRASRALMVADLVFHIGPDSPLATRLVFWLLRGYGHVGPSALERLLVRNRDEAKRSLQRILEWDFERLIMAHGRIVESGGRQALRAGYAWLLQ